MDYVGCYGCHHLLVFFFIPLLNWYEKNLSFVPRKTRTRRNWSANYKQTISAALKLTFSSLFLGTVYFVNYTAFYVLRSERLIHSLLQGPNRTNLRLNKSFLQICLIWFTFQLKTVLLLKRTDMMVKMEQIRTKWCGF